MPRRRILDALISKRAQLEGRIGSIRHQRVLQCSVAGQNRGRGYRIDRNIRTGAEFRTVVMRACKAITYAHVVLAQETEGLRGIEVVVVVVALGVLVKPETLATEGLAPLIRQEIYRSIAQLKAEGLSILLIDKDIKPIARVADRHFVLEKGCVVWSGRRVPVAAIPSAG